MEYEGALIIDRGSAVKTATGKPLVRKRCVPAYEVDVRALLIQTNSKSSDTSSGIPTLIQQSI
jgi:hypothetical protein